MWPGVWVSQSNVFLAKTSHPKRIEDIKNLIPIPNITQSVATILDLIQVFNTSILLQMLNINIFKVEAILLCFQLFLHKWKKACLIIFTDSITVYSELTTAYF